MSTLNEKFITSCQQFDNRTAIKFKDAGCWSTMSYRELLDQSLNVAVWLKSQGFQPQDKAAVVMDNGPLWGIVFFGTILAGGTVVPLDVQANEKDMLALLGDA